jgi:hypothetical protein
MGHLAYFLRLSGPTHGKPPCSFPPSLGDVLPLVPDPVKFYHLAALPVAIVGALDIFLDGDDTMRTDIFRTK